MSKSKSISDLVTDLQQENEQLQHLKKIANQFCKKEFGYNMNDLHHIIAQFEAHNMRGKTGNECDL